MIETFGWNQSSSRIIIEGKNKKEVEERVLRTLARGYRRVNAQGEPMQVKEIVEMSGDIFYACVLERIIVDSKGKPTTL